MNKTRKYYVLITIAIILLVKSVILLIWKKEEVHLAINGWNGSFRDQFFFYLTYAGDGLFALLAILVTLFVRFRYSVLLALSYAGSALVAQIMKQLIFPEVMRPVRYFQELGIDLNLIEKVHHHSYMSFPSGHSTSAYAVFVVLALLTKNRLLATVLILIAALTAFSRVYLSQHFLLDTLAGALIGSAFAWGFFQRQKNWKSNWLDKSLLNLKN